MPAPATAAPALAAMASLIPGAWGRSRDRSAIWLRTILGAIAAFFPCFA